MQLEVNDTNEFPSKAGNVTTLPFVKSSSMVSRVQENMRVKQLKKHGYIERPLTKEDNTFWNDGLSIPLFHIEEQKGLLSGKRVRKHGNPLKLSPPFGNKRDLIHPSMLSRRKKARKEKRQRKLGFNIDEHLAQLKRKQSGVGSNLPRMNILFPERSVNVTRQNHLTTQARMLIPDETKNTLESVDKMQALLEETNEVGQGHCQIDVKFSAPAETDDFTNPFLRKPRMMYPINLKNDNSTEEENKLMQATFGKFIAEE